MEKRQFYKMVFALVLPIALQNLINVGVTAADVIMLGMVGETALSAGSLANQVSFILNLLMFGMSSGAAVLTAQYWGKKDTATIEKVLGISMRLAIVAGLVFMAAALLIPRQLMLIFTQEEEIIAAGIPYLRVVAFSYLLMAVNMTYLNLMRSVERVLIGMITYAVSLGVNVVLNAIFIFGLFGCPAMGTAGAALGTTLARVTEFIIILIYNKKFNDILNIRLNLLAVKDRQLTRDFIRYASPVIMNELAWGCGMAMLSAMMGHLGSAAVAAHSVTQTSRQLAMVVSMGLAGAAAIVLGKTIGEGNEKLARIQAGRFVKMAAILGVAGSLFILAIVRPAVLHFMVMTPQASRYLGYMMFILAYFCFFQSLGTIFIVGIFRAGGDTRVGLALDLTGLWGCAVFLGSIAAFLLKWPVPAVYVVISFDEIVKLPFSVKRYLSGKWLKNITRG
ncbi:MAG TPA: MATE family efflux transporter [Candidatus Ruminococcus avistercoris]|nr:MATE family efflux transporter [Candidatus Ruminococcus avistercoris]